MRKAILGCWLFVFIYQLPGWGQQTVSPILYAIPGNIYTQNFDGLPNIGSFTLIGKGPFSLSNSPFNSANLGGWQFLLTGGTSNNGNFQVSTGSSTASGVLSLGGSNLSDRALGSLASSSGIYAFGLLLTNQSGITLNSITINFTIEQWRKGGSTNKNTWYFRYKTGSFQTIDPPDLTEDSTGNFKSFIHSTGGSSLNGYLPENQQPTNFTLTGITWKNGEQLLLRWDDADESGSDDACGIDNFSFSAKQVIAAPTISDVKNVSLGSRTVIIEGIVNDNNALTQLLIEYDTANNFSKAKSMATQPDNIQPGSGKTIISASISALNPGKVYYYRIKATNASGAATSATGNFTTPAELASISSVEAFSPTLNTVNLRSNPASDGGSDIIEKGFVWSTSNMPTINSNKAMAGGGIEPFAHLLSGLSQGTAYFVRAYAINQMGTSYSPTIPFSTQTTITSLTPTQTGSTNALTVAFTCKMAQPVTGLSAANFQLVSEGIDSCFISSVTGIGLTFSIIVNSGSKDGSIQLQLSNDHQLLPEISNKPFLSTGKYLIDKTPPTIQLVRLPEKVMKVGDTALVSISVKPETAPLKMLSGNINEFPLQNFTRKNDSSYTSFFIITNGGYDVLAAADLTVQLVLIDQAGNSSNVFRQSIVQAGDPIDANKPFIQLINPPKKGLYKSGDSLLFTTRFSEKVFISGTTEYPSLKLTVGNSSKAASYIGGTGTYNLRFLYVIQAGDLDSNGLQFSTSLTLNNSLIKDSMGNPAILTIPNNGEFNILVDGIAPKINTILLPGDKLYTVNDTLTFRVSFSEPIIHQNPFDTPYLKIAIGPIQKNIAYTGKQSGQELLFQYKVQKNDLDKKGVLPMAVVLKFPSTLTDLAGNPATLTYKNTGVISGVKIDAMAPFFTGTDTTINFCVTDSSLLLSDLLQTTDEEKGELLTWTILAKNNAKGITKSSFSGFSTGAKQIPGQFIYLPDVSIFKTDTLILFVTDGINETKKTVLLQADPPIQNNQINSVPIVCSGTIPEILKGSFPSGGNGKYSFQWETASLSDSALFNKINFSQSKDFLPPRLTANTWYRRKVISGNCNDISAPMKLIILKSGLWNGLVSEDWHTAANWCNAIIPDKLTDVWIPPSTNQPMISAAALCRDLNLLPSSKISINGSLETLGDWLAENGLIAGAKGKLIFSGTKKQNITTSILENRLINDLVVNNPAGVNLADTLILTGNLQLHNGLLTTNQKLLIRHSGMIGPAPDETGIDGEVMIEYNLEGGKNQFRLLGHPFSNDIGLQMIKDSLDISKKNGLGNGFTPTDNNAPAAFWFNPLQPNDSLPFDANWQAFTLTNGLSENAWKRYTGIRLLMQSEQGKGLNLANVGKDNSTSSPDKPITLKLKGKLNMGDQEISLSKGPLSGFQVIANPYFSPINLSKITRGNGIGNHYWIWNKNQGVSGGYTAISFENDYRIPAFGAFILKVVKDSNNSLLITENCKTKNYTSDEFPGAQGLADYFISLRLDTDSIFWDRLLLLHSDSAKNWSDRFDAEKLANSHVNFYSLSKDRKKLSIDARPISDETLINLGLATDEPRKFKLHFAECILPNSLSLVLYDRYLNKTCLIEKDSSYYFETTADTESYGNKRFEIKNRASVNQNTTEKLKASLGPVPTTNDLYLNFQSFEKGQTTIKIINQLGAEMKLISLGIQNSGQIKISVGDLIPGLYFVEIKVGHSPIILKLLKL